MSKLVVKIRDDDKYFQHCPLQHEGYCHLPQTHCWSGDGNTLYMMECLGTINKRPPWCPLKEEVKAIPIEWIKRIIKESLYDRYARYEDISEQVDTDAMMKSWAILIERWEKENEIQ